MSHPLHLYFELVPQSTSIPTHLGQDARVTLTRAAEIGANLRQVRVQMKGDSVVKKSKDRFLRAHQAEEWHIGLG